MRSVLQQLHEANSLLHYQKIDKYKMLIWGLQLQGVEFGILENGIFFLQIQ